MSYETMNEALEYLLSKGWSNNKGNLTAPFPWYYPSISVNKEDIRKQLEAYHYLRFEWDFAPCEYTDVL